MTEQHPFKWRHFQSDIILLCVRWYLRYALSYRDLEEMMLESGLQVDHTTIYRWVQTYAPLPRVILLVSYLSQDVLSLRNNICPLPSS